MVLKQKHFIDTHKGATAFWILGLMAYYDAWENVTIWIYLALHGTYGFLWVLKSRIFPDRQWEQRTTLLYGLVIWAGLSLYWITPWLIVTRDVTPPPWFLALCISMYSFGVFFHFASDMQKHVYLKLRPGLITEELWARLRNPNYFGELLIYLGFSLLALHWIPLAALGLFVVAVWIPNMRKKDRSLSRYPEFAAYAERSWRFIPGIW